ncbi:MAG: hypothetical protein CVV27_17620 [Candidatus Melainabacteria bacterium HGW-Melainabacteria-1]|nr:MAG: hypothetical protein CVV27_17620 [Candidatus Melainabacteria bacterium HGW-Melainabacteria-1]
MNAKNCAKRSFSLATGLALLALSGCLSLGANRLPDEPSARQLQACQNQALRLESAQTLWQVRFLGPADPLATAKTPWGSTLRYVIPYTRHTELFELSVSNRSEQVLWVDPTGIALQAGEHQLMPLDQSFFERAWPAGAVADETQLIDRSLALAQVIRTLFVRRPLHPGETYTATLPFLRQDEVPTSLKISGWKRGAEQVSAEFCLSWR